MSAEQPTTNAAAHDTAGQVVTYQGQIATTYYFSSSGGRTENVENVFYGAQPSPYLKGVKDPYDTGSPRHRWQFRYTGGQMKAKLGGLCRGRFKGIKVLKRGVSPRVVSANVVCSGGSTLTNGTTLRARLGLYDSWLTVTRASSAAEKRPAGVAGIVARLLFPRAVVGSFDPKPKSGLVDVDRREPDGSWRLVAHGLVNRAGAYRVPVYGSGTYRVRAGGVAAEPVVIR
jgi:stage II sporulation protein D